MTVIPTLETGRLVLRGPCEADVEPYCNLRSDAEASRFVGGALTQPDTWRVIATILGHWTLRGFGMFAIEEKRVGAFVGLAGPWFPPGFPEPEIGWQLVPSAWGRGLAAEAARASRAYAYGHLGWSTAISLIMPENRPSVRVAERLGAQRDGAFDYRGNVCDVWRHPPPQLAKGD